MQNIEHKNKANGRSNRPLGHAMGVLYQGNRGNTMTTISYILIIMGAGALASIFMKILEKLEGPI